MSRPSRSITWVAAVCWLATAIHHVATRPQSTRPAPNTKPTPTTNAGVLDPFLVTAAEVVNIRRRGRNPACGLVVTRWEPDRPDAGRFPRQALGRPVGSARWLDLSRWPLIAPIFDDRLMLCRAKGFDRVALTGTTTDSTRTPGAPDLSHQVVAVAALVAMADRHGLNAGLVVSPRTSATLTAMARFTIAEIGPPGAETVDAGVAADTGDRRTTTGS